MLFRSSYFLFPSHDKQAGISSVDTIGGTASDTRTVQNKKKKGGGLSGSKKYDTVQSFTASYNTNDSMFGGRVFDDRTDLDFAYGILAKRILGSKPTIKAGFGGTPSVDYKLPITGLKVIPMNTDTVTLTIPSSIKNYKDAWSSIVFAIQDNKTGNGTQVTADQLTTNATKTSITLDKFNTLYLILS